MVEQASLDKSPEASSTPAAEPGLRTRWPVLGATETLAERVYTAVRDRILSSDLGPRVHVREEELANAMGVSRTPVREALSRLATEGFLERLPHRGFRVPERSIDELVNLYPVVQSLELLAGELAFPRITKKDLERLVEVNRGFARAVEANDVAKAVDLNDRFHHVLAGLSGNPVLSRLLDDLRSQVRRLEVLDFSAVLLEAQDGEGAGVSRDMWVKQHAALIDALGCGEQDRALALLRENRSLVVEAKVSKARAIQDAAVGTEVA